MTVALEERMLKAAAKQRREVLDDEDRSLRRSMSTVLHAADIFWQDFAASRGLPQERLDELWRDVHAFERALAATGVRTVPELHRSVRQALSSGLNQELTVKLDDEQFDAAREVLQETVLALTAWRPGAPPARLFADDGDAATVGDAARRLCLICVPRETVCAQRRAQTFDVLHLLAPKLSADRLDTVDRCLQHLDAGRAFEAALHPGLTSTDLTGTDPIGIVPVWSEPDKRRQRWVVTAGSSWVFVSPTDEVTGDDAERVVGYMVPRWERASLPDNGAALGSVLVEMAIWSAARRAQALGRAAESVFSLHGQEEIRDAIDDLARDLAELNAGLDELEVAVVDSRTDLERALASSPGDSDEASLYRSLCESLSDALGKLDRQQQRLQGGFLAAREHASSRHIAATIDQLREHQESISKAQRATDELNAIVGRLTIMLIGPTIVFGALSITDYWITSEYTTAIAMLFAFAVMGFLVSLAINWKVKFFSRLFAPHSDLDAAGRETD